MSSLILNNSKSIPSFKTALQKICDDGRDIDIAVSYVQISGWNILKPLLAKSTLRKSVRLLFDDQLFITHPKAIQYALDYGVQVRSYFGSENYHPKVYLAFRDIRRPTTALIGSANLSESAFTKGIEAGILTQNKQSLDSLAAWFEDLFAMNSQDYVKHPHLLEEYASYWEEYARKRIHYKLKTSISPIFASRKKSVDVETIETLEDILSNINDPLCTLNFDQSGNNIRNINHLMDVLKATYHERSRKQNNELEILGLKPYTSDNLTNIGKQIAREKSSEGVAEKWCHWLLHTSNPELSAINPRLVSFKKSAAMFWRMHPEVIEFFLTADSKKPKDKVILQTIELLCNASEIVTALTLSEIIYISRLFDNAIWLPLHIKAIIKQFNSLKDNKGARGWRSEDRIVLLKSWRKIALL